MFWCRLKKELPLVFLSGDRISALCIKAINTMEKHYSGIFLNKINIFLSLFPNFAVFLIQLISGFSTVSLFFFKKIYVPSWILKLPSTKYNENNFLSHNTFFYDIWKDAHLSRSLTLMVYNENKMSQSLL